MDETPKSIQIETFIFFDLETVGLSKHDKPKILEMSLVAVSRNDLLHMRKNVKHYSNGDKKWFKNGRNSTEDTDLFHKVPELPRVMHKFTRLFYPMKMITPIVEEVTGLSNFNLEHLDQFSKKSAEALKLFLDLPFPVALVAHNGDRFDFPILKSEILNVVENFDEFMNFPIHLVDSLIAFRNIDKVIDKEDEEFYLKSMAEEKDIEDIMNLSQSFTDLPSPQNVERSDSENSRDGESDISNTDNSVLDISDNGFVTPVKSKIEPIQTPNAPLKRKPSTSHLITPKRKSKILSSSLANDVKRNLDFKSHSVKQPYSQPNLYYRLFGEDYNAHRAEADCIALLKICAHYGDRFVEWADENVKLLADIQPMWTKLKK